MLGASRVDVRRFVAPSWMEAPIHHITHVRAGLACQKRVGGTTGEEVHEAPKQRCLPVWRAPMVYLRSRDEKRQPSYRLAEPSPSRYRSVLGFSAWVATLGQTRSSE